MTLDRLKSSTDCIYIGSHALCKSSMPSFRGPFHRVYSGDFLIRTPFQPSFTHSGDLLFCPNRIFLMVDEQ